MELKPGIIPHAERIIEQFITERFTSASSEKAVIGLSGGLDSAVILSFLVSTIGKDRVAAFFLPCGKLSGPDRDFAFESAESCGVKLEEVDITPIVDAVPLKAEGMARGNLMARARMIYLYGYANINNGMVIGTSNKTELLMGYFTKYGDGAADIYPIGDLFKTQVRSMARDLDVPASVIERPPTAGLIQGQTDEGEMGIPYPILDQILMGYLGSLSPESIADNIDHTIITVEEMDRSGFNPPVDEDIVRRIIDVVERNRHKRMSLAIPKVQTSTINLDLRERW